MMINLAPDLQAALQAQVDSGLAESVEALVDKALRAQLAEAEAFLHTLDEVEAEGDRDGYRTIEQVRGALADRRP
jgi:hypothetical protein